MNNVPQNAKNIKIIVMLTGALLLVLATLSFALSFFSLTALAKAHGVAIPAFIPLLLEGGMIVFSLSALVQNIQGHAAKLQWVLIITASVVAMIFNIISAQAGDLVGQILHAIPSIVLLVGFESFLSQLKFHLNHNGAMTGDALAKVQGELLHTKQELERLQAKPDARPKIATSKPATAQAVQDAQPIATPDPVQVQDDDNIPEVLQGLQDMKKPEAVQLIANLQRNGYEFTNADLAKAAGKNASTISRWQSAINKALAMHEGTFETAQNGNGVHNG